MEVFALLHHILPVQNGGHGGGISGRTSDALLFHSADERCIGIVGGGLGEVLVPGEVPKLQGLSLPQRRQGRFLLLLLLVPSLFVHGGIAGEFQTGGAGPEAVVRGLHLHRHAVINGVGHLAGHETTPDQPVEPVLLAGQVLFHLLRRPVHVAGADGLVGVLGCGFCLVAVRALGGIVVRAVTAQNELPGGGNGLLGKPQGVGSHIGDEAHGALALDVHALIELLGDGHGAPGRHGELAGGLLLHGGSGKGRRGRALLVGPLDALDHKGGVFRGFHHGLHFVGRFELRFLAAYAVITGGKGQTLDIAAQEIGIQRPVLLRLEGLDLPVPVVHHPGGHRLDPPGGKAPANLLPQQGAEFIAHDPVQNPAGLLGIHQLLVNVPGLPDALLHHVLGDLVERHPPALVVRQVQELLQVPGNGLSLAVRVGCKIDHVRAFSRLLQITDNILFALDGFVDRLEIMLQIHAQGTLGQVPEMAHAGLHCEILAQIFTDGLGLRGRLHDDQAVFCHCVPPNAPVGRVIYSKRFTLRV